MLRGKNIIIGVTGSIAAYKSAQLVRLFVKEGADVKVIMTPSSKEFIGPLTLSTLSKHPVISDFFEKKTGEWSSHVELGLWADLFLVAPATANTISKFANGQCDTLLTAVYLSARCPVCIAPAMDMDMYQHPSTQANINSLKSYGNTIINAAHGELASGLVGEGRMAEPEEIVEYVRNFFFQKQTLRGKKALVTAGPTYEPIDPVRFIGNHSSGKMGYAIADELARQGAEVTLISGPSNQKTEEPDVQVVHIQTAEEMANACTDRFSETDIAVLAAAVADYKPEILHPDKLKKTSETLDLSLVKTIDIAATLGAQKKDRQIIVGFALETSNELENAKDKLKRKNFDLIVLNSLRDEGAGFGHDTNKVRILDKKEKIVDFELKSKKAVAKDIVNAITESLK